LTNKKHMSEDKRAMNYGSSGPIYDSETVAHLENFKPNLHTVMTDENVIQNFCNKYTKWITSTKLNSYKGLDSFQYATYANATSESFDKFYMRNNTRRFRCFKGEYMYHQLAWRNSWPDWQYIELDDLKENDAVVISYPFSDTGKKHPQQDTVLERCTELGIPVLLDCVFAGVARDLEFDFTYPCITDITFSLSKIFPVAYARIGMRLTREDDDDTLFVYQKIAYHNRIGAALGLHFIEHFDVDYVSEKYYPEQIKLCKQLNVEPSNTVFFGLGGNEWKQYNRGGQTNRLSFHKIIHNGVK